jgi:hypothetical protein
MGAEVSLSANGEGAATSIRSQPSAFNAFLNRREASKDARGSLLRFAHPSVMRYVRRKEIREYAKKGTD